MSRQMRSGRPVACRVLCALLGALLVCSGLAGCADQESDDTVYKGQEGAVMVSLGDSYSSGEGVTPFYDQNESDKAEKEDWLAHRSTKSWPGKLKVNNETVLMSDNKANPDDPVTDPDKAAWYFLASSGAETKHILKEDQTKEVDVDPDTGEHKLFSLTSERRNDQKIPCQLNGLEQIAGAKGVDYVTMTIGGNDVGFSDVIVSCFTSTQGMDFRGVHNALEEAEKKYDSWARESIKEAYTEVSKAAGPDAHVIVAGYPTLLDSQKNHLVFHRNESLEINNKVEWFNAELELIVREVNADNDGSRAQVVFVSVADEFRGHEAYTDKAYINKVIVPSQDEDLATNYYSAYSVHPNEHGTDAYARCVQEAINQIEGTDAESASPDDHEPRPSGGEKIDLGDKDVALVLDVSGSMDGRPLEETKNAAGQFVNIAIESEAECALVTYSYEAEVLSGFSSDDTVLRSEILDLDSLGGTNIEDGLLKAEELLATRSDDAQFIVLMSDGEPTTGKGGDDLIAYAESIRDPDGDGVDDVIIYTLGFNEDASGEDLLRGIASEGCYFAVDDPEDLEAFFKDMADAISGVKFANIRVACPVDVEVTYNGETLSSAGDDPVTRTSFGSLGFEEELDENGNPLEGEENLVKVLRLREGPDYEIEITGYDTGTMDYSIGFMDDEGRYSDFRTFSNIEVTDEMRASTTAGASDATIMRIDEDGDGTYDLTLRAGPNEEGEPVDNAGIVIGVLVAYGVLFALVAALVVGSLVRQRERCRAAAL